MEAIFIVALALFIGAGAGLALAAVRRREIPPVPVERIEARLEVQSAEMRRLADAARSGDGETGRLTAEISAARRSLGELSVREEERRVREGETIEIVRRLSGALAGGSSKGRFGENILREQLAALPPGMLVTDFRVNGKVVEYGLELPDGRRLPIDSKWSADAELAALEAADGAAASDAAMRSVEKVVGARAKEVAQYLDPALTAPVAVAAVPDAAYEAIRKAHTEAFARGVVIVPYSTALPILLFLHSLVSRYGSAGDVQACLSDIGAVLEGVENVLENKFARAATMLSNGNDELRAQVGKARGSLARARGTTVDAPERDAAEALLRAVE
ncbi:MAG: DNA recombination protein RmuC [Actinomycetota bacterium]